jgi:fused signal recognition particle receptor
VSTVSNASTAAGSGFFGRLRARLNRGKAWLTSDVFSRSRGKLDDDTRESLENELLLADVGVATTEWLLEQIEQTPAKARDESIRDALSDAIMTLLGPLAQPIDFAAAHPYVILAVGVNGTGKTTTIGKLASRLTRDGRTVLLAAGDTFRAAAVEQLVEWGERAGCPVVRQAEGADPAAVVHDALGSAQARDTDVVIADTAGRLHTAQGLMDELQKIRRVASRSDPAAPHEVLLVLDASQGQNALVQAREFHRKLGVTGLVLTKLDGTAKGGIVLAIARELSIPIRYIAIGESVEDFAPFDAGQFAAALLGEAAHGDAG